MEDAAGLVARDVVVGAHPPVLDGVSVAVAAGRMVAVTGPSGSGKTTLLSVLGGLLPATSGHVTFAGRPVPGGAVGGGTAYVLQGYGLVPSLTASENVAIALRAGGVGAQDSSRRADAALERVGVGDLGDRLVQELSGGQLQRVAVARALATGAALLLADEPTSELDEVNRDLVVAELRAEAERGAVVVLATHDAEVAAACDDALRLDEGRLVTAAPAAAPAGVTGPGHEHDAFRRPS